MCFASGLLASAALAPAGLVLTEAGSGCFDALNFTELRCFLSAAMFGVGDSFKRGFRDRGEGGRENLTLSNKNVLTAFCFAETWEGFCLFSSVQQKDILKPQNL